MLIMLLFLLFQEYTGPAFRHGCTTDVKRCWERSAEGLRQFLGDAEALHKELVARNLVSRNVASSTQLPKKKAEKVKARRKQPRARVTANASTFGVNAHIKGSALEKVILEARAKAEMEERQR
jgi:hypothetical protein